MSENKVIYGIPPRGYNVTDPEYNSLPVDYPQTTYMPFYGNDNNNMSFLLNKDEGIITRTSFNHVIRFPAKYITMPVSDLYEGLKDFYMPLFFYDYQNPCNVFKMYFMLGVRLTTSSLGALDFHIPTEIGVFRKANNILQAYTVCNFTSISENSEGSYYYTGATISSSNVYTNENMEFVNELPNKWRLPNNSTISFFIPDLPNEQVKLTPIGSFARAWVTRIDGTVKKIIVQNNLSEVE